MENNGMDLTFKQRLESITRNGSISVILLLAKELGIFDALNTTDIPLTSRQLADSLKLKERYVREILGCLVSAGLVQISCSGHSEEEVTQYLLSDEAKEVIRTSPSFVDIDLIGLLSSAYPHVKACCAADGPYGAPFNDAAFKFMYEKGEVSSDEIMQQILSNCPGLRGRLENGIRVVEFGSGTGHLISKFATTFPQSTFTGTEVSSDIVTQSAKRWEHISNLRFMVIDACNMNGTLTDKFDWLLINNALHHLPHPLAGLKNMRKLIEEEGGTFAFMDMAGLDRLSDSIGDAHVASIYAFSTMMCLQDSFQCAESEAHGPCWKAKTIVALLNQAGFQVEVTMLSQFDILLTGKCMVL